MSNLLGAIPALIGVVVGVAATGWADRVRWKRGQAVRWDERRVDVYAEYARAIKRIHMRQAGQHIRAPAAALPIGPKRGKRYYF